MHACLLVLSNFCAFIYVLK
uniref:Uncharacterized protein n=1 Tax=Arundo donax TaxID=35708 RepID=A0A0A9GLX6_ARUDO